MEKQFSASKSSFLGDIAHLAPSFTSTSEKKFFQMILLASNMFVNNQPTNQRRLQSEELIIYQTLK